MFKMSERLLEVWGNFVTTAWTKAAGIHKNPWFQEWNGRKNSHVSTKGNKTNLNAIKEFSGKTLQQEGISKTHLHNISPTTNSEYKASCYLFGAEIIHQRVATLGVAFQVFSSPFLIFFLAAKKKKTWKIYLIWGPKKNLPAPNEFCWVPPGCQKSQSQAHGMRYHSASRPIRDPPSGSPDLRWNPGRTQVAQVALKKNFCQPGRDLNHELDV